MESKMTLANRIAKKISRRFRVKGTHIRPTAGLTVAELLITSWFGIPIPKQVGWSDAANRQYERLIAHRKQWNNTPKSTKVSRQVSRQVRRQVRRRLDRKGYQSVIIA